MKSFLMVALGIIMTPLYLGAYVVSNLLCLKGKEDMESPREWVELILSLGETEE